MLEKKVCRKLLPYVVTSSSGVWPRALFLTLRRSYILFNMVFKRAKSCVTQLIEVFYDIGHALDRGLESDIIYLDFAKAFDSVSGKARVESKLKRFGIDEPLLSWFYSYLTGRRQRVVIYPDDQTTQTTETPGFKPFTVLVVINRTFSNWTDVGSSVPQ